MSLLVVLSVALMGILQMPQASSLDAKEKAALIERAQKAVVRALDYRQGDRESLVDAKDDFTADGWREFMKRMEGWIDSKGAPTGSSSFTPSGNAVIVDQDSGLTHLKIPGTLKQTQNSSATTYRVVVDVRLDGNPLKIAHLEPTVQARPNRR